MLTKIWEIMVRWRTWLANSFFALLLFVPDILNQPEVLAIIPANYSKYVVAAAFLINIDKQGWITVMNALGERIRAAKREGE